jgi:GT2 family glycosyltransferase
MIDSDIILIIVVLYKKRLSESAIYKSLEQITWPSSKGIDLLVYDNSPAEFIQEEINPQGKFVIKYIRDTSNSGVSKAYNEGALLAQTLQKKWVVFFDQDTLLPANFFTVLLDSIARHPEQVLFVPRLMANNIQLSPCRYLFAKGIPYKKEHPAGICTLKRKNLLNSCLCIRLDAFFHAGGYRDRVHLYYSDFVFINYFKKKYPTFFLLDVNIPHGMSALENGIQNQLRTFSLFCIGAREALIVEPGYAVFYFMHTLMRCCLLAWRYKHIRFVKIFLNYFLSGKNG